MIARRQTASVLNLLCFYYVILGKKLLRLDYPLLFQMLIVLAKLILLHCDTFALVMFKRLLELLSMIEYWFLLLSFL